jgi:hypothetical protein
VNSFKQLIPSPQNAHWCFLRIEFYRCMTSVIPCADFSGFWTLWCLEWIFKVTFALQLECTHIG